MTTRHACCHRGNNIPIRVQGSRWDITRQILKQRFFIYEINSVAAKQRELVIDILYVFLYTYQTFR